VKGWENPRDKGPREAGKTAHNGLLKAIINNQKAI